MVDHRCSRHERNNATNKQSAREMKSKKLLYNGLHLALSPIRTPHKRPVEPFKYFQKPFNSKYSIEKGVTPAGHRPTTLAAMRTEGQWKNMERDLAAVRRRRISHDILVPVAALSSDNTSAFTSKWKKRGEQGAPVIDHWGLRDRGALKTPSGDRSQSVCEVAAVSSRMQKFESVGQQPANILGSVNLPASQTKSGRVPYHSETPSVFEQILMPIDTGSRKHTRVDYSTSPSLRVQVKLGAKQEIASAGAVSTSGESPTQEHSKTDGTSPRVASPLSIAAAGLSSPTLSPKGNGSPHTASNRPLLDPPPSTPPPRSMMYGVGSEPDPTPVATAATHLTKLVSTSSRRLVEALQNRTSNTSGSQSPVNSSRGGSVEFRADTHLRSPVSQLKRLPLPPVFVQPPQPLRLHQRDTLGALEVASVELRTVCSESRSDSMRDSGYGVIKGLNEEEQAVLERASSPPPRSLKGWGGGSSFSSGVEAGVGVEDVVHREGEGGVGVGVVMNRKSVKVFAQLAKRVEGGGGDEGGGGGGGGSSGPYRSTQRRTLDPWVASQSNPPPPHKSQHLFEIETASTTTSPPQSRSRARSQVVPGSLSGGPHAAGERHKLAPLPAPSSMGGVVEETLLAAGLGSSRPWTELGAGDGAGAGAGAGGGVAPVTKRHLTGVEAARLILALDDKEDDSTLSGESEEKGEESVRTEEASEGGKGRGSWSHPASRKSSRKASDPRRLSHAPLLGAASQLGALKSTRRRSYFFRDKMSVNAGSSRNLLSLAADSRRSPRSGGGHSAGQSPRTPRLSPRRTQLGGAGTGLSPIVQNRLKRGLMPWVASAKLRRIEASKQEKAARRRQQKAERHQLLKQNLLDPLLKPSDPSALVSVSEANASNAEETGTRQDSLTVSAAAQGGDGGDFEVKYEFTTGAAGENVQRGEDKGDGGGEGELHTSERGEEGGEQEERSSTEKQPKQKARAASEEEMSEEAIQMRRKVELLFDEYKVKGSGGKPTGIKMNGYLKLLSVVLMKDANLLVRTHNSRRPVTEKMRSCFSAFDPDGDGVVVLRDLRRVLHKILFGTTKEKCHFIFSVYDLDRSGAIDVEELRRVRNSADGDLWESSIFTQALLNMLDRNHDSVLQFSEFYRAILANKFLFDVFANNFPISIRTHEGLELDSRQFVFTWDTLQSMWVRMVSRSNSHDTQVNLKGFRVVIGKLFLARSRQDGPVSERLFSFFDVDKDGSISLRDFITGMSIICYGSKTQLYRFYFYVFDLDGGGTIGQSELLRLLYSSIIAGDMTDDMREKTQNVEQIFRRLDSDGDGEVDVTEWCDALAKYPALSRYFDEVVFGVDGTRAKEIEAAPLFSASKADYCNFDEAPIVAVPRSRRKKKLTRLQQEQKAGRMTVLDVLRTIADDDESGGDETSGRDISQNDGGS